MLPLVGQQLALAHPGNETMLMSTCVIAAQLVMLPIARGARADRWGRKPLFLAAFAILPLRGVLYTLSDNPYWLVGVQLLDGVCAGLFGGLTRLFLADPMRGTGRYNLGQGAVAGYDVAYLVLAATAFVAFTEFFFAMPETREPLTSAELDSFRQRAAAPSDGMEAPGQGA